MRFSFIIPVYNSEKTVAAVAARIAGAVRDYNPGAEYEIFLVNDGSRDNALASCREAADRDANITVLNLSRNFGQANAVMAGFARVSGDFVIALDDDLQTPPEAFGQLVDKLINDDLDIVYGTYEVRHTNVTRSLGSRVNMFMQSSMLDKPKHVRTSSYFAARRFLVDEALKFKFPDPYLPGLFFRQTKRVDNVLIEHNTRTEGISGYTIKRLLRLWMNGLIEFSIKPVRLVSMLGGCVIGLSLLWLLVALLVFLIAGYSGFIAPVVALFSGVQLLCLGLVGEYCARALMGANSTPQYIVRDEYRRASEGGNE